ncbi:potassium transporter Kup [Microvirga lotononidis]|uniref:Probable potassium transport system protein Kup n=1 Tax=Microvirga lotononidis TaxID=864069 RepID=I4YM53_9HYPH|nr:potassium transporter Kup [Microvirga lotononidis]EIM25045.1 K+ transporter [Microvirga lotononidis]WQO29463.1 potassium transporter Kup [Microvirga lotononidis]
MAQQNAVAPGHADSPVPEATLPDSHSKASFWTLTLGAIGVVYGDIGTSPLYAMRETVMAATGGHHGTPVPLTRELVISILSLLLWALILTVSVKYVLLLLRADNKGEGGSLTLVALAQRALGRRSLPVLMMGMAGAALFYGDAAITPAISVLSALEGLKLVTPSFDAYVLPGALVILIALFTVQSRGTGKVAAFFGPLTLLWFISMAGLGLIHIADDWEVLLAFNPYYGVSFLLTHPGTAFAILGSVCLAVTGAEALYADLGHFGRNPIRVAWGSVVFPALALNYLGQGALVLSNPEAITNPFFLLAPPWLLLPLVILATLATIVASQAVITGAFSLTRQAVQLGLLPRLEVRFTSETHQGQIYLPRVNWLLLGAVVGLVLLFGSSSSLASAYGIAVFGTMVVTTLLACLVMSRSWGWGPAKTGLIMIPLLLIDLTFLSSNLVKLLDGGYVPLIIASVFFVVMWTWVKGTRILFEKTRKIDVPFLELVQMLEKSPPHRVKGTAVFLTSDPDTAPAALLHNLKHNKVLHEKNVILTVNSADVPRVEDEDRVTLEHVGDSFWRIRLSYGYMETPNIPRGLAILRKQGFKFDIMATSFFLSRRSIRPASQSGMPLWQDKLFISLAKSASDATDFFQIPTGRVVEVGTQVTV